jgi:hypothetical protein
MRKFVAIALLSAVALQATPLLAAPAVVRNSLAGSVQAPAATIAGTIRNATGLATPDSLQLRDLDTGRVAATTTSNARGAFSFGPRRPGNYAVELVTPTGAIVGASAAIATLSGAAASVSVADARTIQSAADEARARIAEAEAAARVRAAAILAEIRALIERIRNLPSPSF